MDQNGLWMFIMILILASLNHTKYRFQDYLQDEYRCWQCSIVATLLPLAKACQSLAKRCGVLARHAELPGARFRQNAAVIAVDSNIASLIIDQPSLVIMALPFPFPDPSLSRVISDTDCMHEARIAQGYARIIKKSRIQISAPNKHLERNHSIDRLAHEFYAWIHFPTWVTWYSWCSRADWYLSPHSLCIFRSQLAPAQRTSPALQMLPPLVTYLDAARACAAADVPAAMALAMEMAKPATGIWQWF